MAYIGQSARATTEPKAETYHMLELFGDVLTRSTAQYVTPVDDKKLIEAAMEGMLTSLDPHSDYLTPDAYADMQDQTRGEYGGLGLEITERGRRGQGDLADRRHPGGARRHQARRLHHRRQRPERAGPVGQRRGQADARQGRRGGDADHRAARSPIRSTSSWCARSSSRSRSPTTLEGDYGYLRLSGFNEKATDETQGRDRRPARQGPAPEGPGARPAQQSRRPARPGGRRLRACSSTAARWSPSAAATRRTSSATTPRATT